MNNAEHNNHRDFVDEFGRNRLHYAANNGILLKIEKLLNEGVDVDANVINDIDAFNGGVLLKQLYFDFDGSNRKQLFVRGIPIT